MNVEMCMHSVCPMEGLGKRNTLRIPKLTQNMLVFFSSTVVLPSSCTRRLSRRICNFFVRNKNILREHDSEKLTLRKSAYAVRKCYDGDQQFIDDDA